MPHHLAQASEADLPNILKVQFAAFAEDPLIRLMYPFPTPPSTFNEALERAQREFRNPDVAYLRITDTESGEIISFAKWIIYKHERPEEVWNKEETRDWGEGTNVEVADAFIGAINRNRKKIMAGKPHCLLNLLDTLPAHQRRGAGTQLVKWGADVADQHGLPCYLEGSPAGYHLYRKFGFEDVENLDMDLTRWGGEGIHRFVCMIRPANGKTVPTS